MQRKPRPTAETGPMDHHIVKKGANSDSVKTLFFKSVTEKVTEDKKAKTKVSKSAISGSASGTKPAKQDSGTPLPSGSKRSFNARSPQKSSECKRDKDSGNEGEGESIIDCMSV